MQYGAKSMSIIKRACKKVLPESVQRVAINKLKKDRRIRLVYQADEVVLDAKGGAISGVVPLIYWDGKPNFGDMIGPYLISKISGKPVVNVKDTNAPGYMSVGSILQLVNRKGLIVWGSGLIDAPSNELACRLSKYNPRILSVRGSETATQLKRIGLEIANLEASGDPALLMPRFYSPKSIAAETDVAVCPHYLHKQNFLNMTFEGEVSIVDVQENLEVVIDKITSARVCVSSSLHGLIIAQAYGIPWVWLEVVDKKLGGGDFKFNDFFSTLDSSQVSRVQVKLEELEDIEWRKLAEKAFLPNKKYKEHLILDVIENQLGQALT